MNNPQDSSPEVEVVLQEAVSEPSPAEICGGKIGFVYVYNGFIPDPAEFMHSSRG